MQIDSPGAQREEDRHVRGAAVQHDDLFGNLRTRPGDAAIQAFCGGTDLAAESGARRQLARRRVRHPSPPQSAASDSFLVCANALGAWCLELQARGKGTTQDIEKDLRANLLPGVTIVPAMVIAIEKAQAAGIRYNRQ